MRFMSPEIAAGGTALEETVGFAVILSLSIMPATKSFADSNLIKSAARCLIRRHQKAKNGPIASY